MVLSPIPFLSDAVKIVTIERNCVYFWGCCRLLRGGLITSRMRQQEWHEQQLRGGSRRRKLQTKHSS